MIFFLFVERRVYFSIFETKRFFIKLIDWFYVALLSVAIQINVNECLRESHYYIIKSFDLELWGNPIIKLAKESQINHLRNFLYIFLFFLIWKYQKYRNEFYIYLLGTKIQHIAIRYYIPFRWEYNKNLIFVNINSKSYIICLKCLTAILL